MDLKKASLFFLLFFVLVCGLRAQKAITNQQLYWLRYSNTLIINDKLNWQNEAELRRFWRSNVQHHFIAHSRLHYRFAPQSNVAMGFTYSMQSPNDPFSQSDLVVPELRGVQEINHGFPLGGRFSLQQRFRIDERFVRRNDGIELLDGYTFNFRFRIRVQLSALLSGASTRLKSTIKVSNELMVNAGQNIVFNYFDQNRFYLGYEQDVASNFSVELGYMKWFQQTAAGSNFFSRDILRFTLAHKIDPSNNPRRRK